MYLVFQITLKLSRSNQWIISKTLYLIQKNIKHPLHIREYKNEWHSLGVPQPCTPWRRGPADVPHGQLWPTSLG